jgi:hypothetical protein
MLTDAEIVTLRKKEAYQKKLVAGTDGLITDLIKAGKGDFKPDVSFWVKAAHLFVKARTIRKELKLCSCQFLERILNRELQWPRIPNSVRAICEADKEHFVWMRYDTPRVETLFGCARDLITDAEYRNLIKSESSLNGDKNQRLLEIVQEIDRLLVATLRSIATRGVFDDLVKLQSEEYYRENETAIQKKFLGASKGGALGLLPEDTTRKES